MILRAPTQWLGASAITIWPIILVASDRLPSNATLRHEEVHLEQQRGWAIYGLGVGLLVWFALYLLALPVWRNPWREKWEREAYSKANGLSDKQIDEILQHRPYYLWGLSHGR